MGDNRWIVTNKEFREHKLLERAQAEVARLQKLKPDIPFRIYRVKQTIDLDDPHDIADAAVRSDNMHLRGAIKRLVRSTPNAPEYLTRWVDNGMVGPMPEEKEEDHD